MKYNNFWNLMGISLICITVFGVSNANAKTTTMFTFTVDKPVNGQDACAPKIETEHGTGEYEECIRIKTTQQIMGANGCVADTTVTPNPTYSGWICSGNDGQTGNSCSVARVDDTATGKNIVMKCGNTETNVPVNNGTNGTACSVKSSTRDGKSVTTKFDCGGVETEVVTNDGNDGQAGNSCSVARVDDTATGKNIVMKCGNTETNVPVNNGTDGTACSVKSSTRSGKAVTTKFDCGGVETEVVTNDGNDGQAGISCAMNAVKKDNGDLEFTKQCDNDLTPTTVTMTTAEIATAATNKIVQDGTVALKEDLSGMVTTTSLKTDIESSGALNGYATTSQLADKADKTQLNGMVTTTSLKTDIESSGALNGYVTTSGSGNNSIGKILEANNVITTSNIGNNIPGTVAMKDDLNRYVTQQNIGTAVDNAISENTNILQGGKNGQTLDQVIAEKVAAALTTAAASCSDDGAETVTCTSQVAQAFQALAGRSGVTTNKNTSD